MSPVQGQMMLVLLSGTACFAAFCWGLRRHFRPGGPIPAGMRLISALSLLGFAWFAWRVCTARLAESWPAAVILFAASLALFAWAVAATRRSRLTVAFATDEPCFLVRHGPYRHVRHPFYSAYLLFWAGTAVVGPGWAPWGVVVLMALVYRIAASREEAKFGRSALGGAYAEYRASTGMFLPRILPRRPDATAVRAR